MHANYSVPVNWFDVVVVITVLLGLNKGRKRGMSEELVVTIQWVAIIFAGAFLYKPLGDMLCQSSPVSHVFAYIAMYITVAIVVKIIFSALKKAMGGKLLEANFFGRGEYYLGMFAGTIRFACILMAVLALLNAPYYTPQEIAQSKAAQIDL